MTEVRLFCKEDGSFCRCIAEGHAGFAKRGKDIVCAAESSLLRTALSVLQKTDGIQVVSDAQKRGRLDFSVLSFAAAQRNRLICVADFIRCGFEELSSEYPAHIKFFEEKADWFVPVED